MQWFKTKYPGIRYRQHNTRKHGIQPDRYYVLTYKYQGKTKTEALGWSSEGMTLDRAVEAMAEIKANRRTGTGPDTLSEKKRLALEAKQAAEVEKARIKAERLAAEQAEVERLRLEKETRFDVVFEKYCESHADKKSLKDEKTLIRLWVEPVVKDKQLYDITAFDVERIKRNMLNAGRSMRSVQYSFAVIRQIFNYAKSRNIFDGESPTKGVKLGKFDNKRMRFLSPEEAAALLDEIKKHSITSYRISLLSLYSGMRFGEIANLKWQQVDLKNNQIIILDPKNGSTRAAFMAGAVHQMLSEMPEGKPDELIFGTRDNKAMKQVSDSFMDAVNTLGLNDGVSDRRMKVVFHTLRHSAASHLAMSGADLSTIQSVLGHKTLSMTERYSHLTNKHIRNAIDRLQDTLEVKQADVIPMPERAG